MRYIIENRKVITLGIIFFFIYTFIGVVFFYNIRTDSEQKAQLLENKAFIAPSVTSGKTSVENKVVAEKLDFERKIIKPTSPQKVAEIIRIIQQQGGEVLKSSPGMVVAHIPKETEEKVNQELITTNSTKILEVDYPTFLAADSPDWGVRRIQAPEVWKKTTATGIKIAVIDTGMDYTHKDLQGRYAGGYDTVNEDSNPFDDHGHGTHVSGIIASTLDGAGLAGVAPGVQILALKALGSDGSGFISNVVEAVDWAMNNGAQVINFSLGTTFDSKTLESKLNEAAAKGIVLVAAAGNTNGGSLLFPAAYGSVISVSATDSNDNFASFSSVGAEIAAPGVSVESTVPGNGYAFWSGTSMASPHVVATVALMLANKQTNIRQNLQNTAIDLGSPGKDSLFGYGLVHAKPAALGEDVLAPVVTFLSPENNSAVYGQVEVKLDVQDENILKTVKLLVDNQQVQEWLAPPYIYQWDTTGKDGVHELLAQAKDEFDNTGEVKVTVTVSKDPISSPTPTATPSSTPRRMDRQERGQDFRQDFNREQAEQNRQNFQNVPDFFQEEVPEVSNINERNQKPETSFANESRNTNGRYVRGASTQSLWQILKEQVLHLFAR